MQTVNAFSFRWPAGIAMALAITVLLFYVMQSLIAGTRSIIDNADTGFIVELVKPPEMEPLKTRQETPVRPPEPEPIPRPPEVLLDGPGITEIGSNAPPPQPVTGTGPSLALLDGVYLPIVRVEPAYPRRALSNGVEGYTIVEFDVAADGSVRNPRIIDFFPTSVFNSASLDAISKFRYKPQVENGKAMMVIGVRNRFTFTLEAGD